MSAPKILVVFFSRSGTTRRIATALSATLGGSIEEIVEGRGRDGFLGYWRSIIEARRGHLPSILPAKNDPSSFDLVVIGTPVWAWSVSSPVRSYLTANKDRLPAVAFFCTLGGKGSETAFAQMQGIIGKPPRATCAITARDVASGGGASQLADFVAALQRHV
ncbi:MAG: flavodoxin [Bradyrhizobium sp.]|uniref:flavodoxin family protein n=1 Tax=Bradyrhizobium sp. TaxID=376 RepID=UPI0012203325|nr:flavodoxin [Bradyrhizobium sp.]THD46926.1 MAG: flavodoxin [Bradyrhizobium sp.]